MKRSILRTLGTLGCALFVAAAPVAQGQTWIVDAQNGPGTNFTDLPPALQVAQDGDTVLVRTGRYTGGAITRGIALIAEPGATVSVAPTASGESLAISGLGPTQTCVVHDISYQPFPIGTVWPDTFLSIVNCRGRVHIEGVNLDVRGAQSVSPTGIDVANCDHVTIHDAHITGGNPLLLWSSTVLVTDSSLEGEDHASGLGGYEQASPAIHVVGSTLTLSRTDLQGGGGGFSVPVAPKPAIEFWRFGARSQILITGTDTTTVAAGRVFWYGAESAISGGGAGGHTIIVDPRVKLVPNAGAPAITPGNTVTIERYPSLTADGAGPGGLVSVDLLATSGDLAEIYLSLPFGPVVPPIASWGAIWVDFRALLVLGRFQVPASETVGVSFTLPSIAALQGSPVSFQGLTLSAAAGFRFSTPATVVLN